jgi:hypothetical protein
MDATTAGDAQDAGALACADTVARGDVLGCDYLAIVPQTLPGAGQWQGTFSDCFAAVIINTNETAATLSVTLDSASEPLSFHTNLIAGEGRSVTYMPFPANDQVPPHSAAVISLAQGAIAAPGEACPSAPIVGQAQMQKVDVLNGIVNVTVHAVALRDQAASNDGGLRPSMWA